MHIFWVCMAAIAAAVTVTPSTDRDSHIRLQTLPQFRPPLLEVTVHDAERLGPGYLFMAPYSQLAAKQITDPAEAYITGPLIYDHNGQLIWIGSTMFPGRDAHGFRTVTYKGETMLSFIISPNEFYPEHPGGMAVLINSHYEVVDMTLPLFNEPWFNIHEYNIIDDGRSVLTLYSKPTLVDETWILDDGIAEIELATGATLFRWSSLEHIPLNASNFDLPKAGSTTDRQAWDWFHANSIDKDAAGDYLLSSRHTSSIYKISGTNGSILWTLSGNSPDIDHSNNLNFSWQHDARFLSSNATTTILSFFDNAGVGASDPSKTTGNCSRGVVLEMNTSVFPITTNLLRSYNHPNREISIARGNMQTLPNDNVFINWATKGLVSEFSSSGSLLMTAKFSDENMGTYRGYKFPFEGRPLTPPLIKSMIHGSSSAGCNTFHYISWNGATDVKSWNLWGSERNISEAFSLLAKVDKTGFETMYMTTGYIRFVFVEAVGNNGEVMARSVVITPETPKTWTDEKTCAENGICAVNMEETAIQNSSEDEDASIKSDGNHGLDFQNRVIKSSMTVIEDVPLVLIIGLLGVSLAVFGYLFMRLFRRRKRGRYQRVE
ncbi:hypothetical protein E4T48_07085 [Aureobasidium sp. EXF-10727]|nr:hypothetical protein E4T48_07085 [Aureobasidium sp. EXF-10727]